MISVHEAQACIEGNKISLLVYGQSISLCIHDSIIPIPVGFTRSCRYSGL